MIALGRKPNGGAGRQLSGVHGAEGTARLGQRPAASLEPLRPEVLVVQVLSHLLEILHVSAARQETRRGWATRACHLVTHTQHTPGMRPRDTSHRRPPPVVRGTATEASAASTGVHSSEGTYTSDSASLTFIPEGAISVTAEKTIRVSEPEERRPRRERPVCSSQRQAGLRTSWTACRRNAGKPTLQAGCCHGKQAVLT